MENAGSCIPARRPTGRWKFLSVVVTLSTLQPHAPADAGISGATHTMKTLLKIIDVVGIIIILGAFVLSTPWIATRGLPGFFTAYAMMFVALAIWHGTLDTIIDKLP